MMTSNKLSQHYLDLRNIPCPMNFVRCKLALEVLSSRDELLVDLDLGEPEDSVSFGLIQEGYSVEVVSKGDNLVRLKVIVKSD